MQKLLKKLKKLTIKITLNVLKKYITNVFLSFWISIGIISIN